uniref:NADH-ubiquinone oxidoreductase chain 3 n=1 Tax=Anaulaciulus koreanus TaxID=1977246 RepID=A0A1X8VJ11_9MYRI|nr:NADH dehydrogenase subunit 3 [Anaulaciulus koreanus]ARF02894.1 NADH dehydrogenase subunit 3 [Anaulaciulus koreanus]
MLLIISLMILLLALILFSVFMFSSLKVMFNREFLSPFECGFDPYQTARMPFSLQFFLIAVIFLIFDIEIVILMPLPMSFGLNYPMNHFLVLMIFILILLLGTYYEWLNGALDWTI